MKNLKFKKEEWCFCEFKLQQVMETKENRITGVSDGMFRLGSSDLTDRCFPIEMTIKQISDTVAFCSKEFHSLKNNSLNHPDLNRELIKRWVEMCENKDDKEKLDELYTKLHSFRESIINKVRDLNFEEVEGISLFRR